MSRRVGNYVLVFVGAAVALVAALGWALDRLGVLTDPLAGVEGALIAHPWSVVAGIAVVAACCWTTDRRVPSGVGAGARSELVEPAPR